MSKLKGTDTIIVHFKNIGDEAGRTVRENTRAGVGNDSTPNENEKNKDRRKTKTMIERRTT